MNQYKQSPDLRLKLICAAAAIACLLLPNISPAQVLESFTEPVQRVNISAPMAGVLKKINIKPGSKVLQGQLIAELDYSVLLESKRLAKAKAQATAKLESAQIEMDVESKRLKKLLELQKSGNASQSEIEKSQAKVSALRKEAEAIQEEKLIHEIEVDRIQAEINLRRISSPIAGTVVKVEKSVGEFIVGHEPTIAQVVNLNRLKAKFFVLPEQSELLRGREKCRIELPRQQTTLWAEIEYHSPITAASSGTVEIQVSFRNEAASFRSGELVRLLFETDKGSQQQTRGSGESP